MADQELSPECSSQPTELEELKVRLDDLEARLKENPTSLFAASKTMLRELDEYRQGSRDLNSLRPATIGLVFAYLRPRMVLVTGSLLAATFGFAQLWFLWNQQQQIEQQNQLVEQQNHLVAQQSTMLAAQTKANEVSAVSELILALDPRDSIRSSLAAVQLGTFGEAGASALLTLSYGSGPAANRAAEILYNQADNHSPTQIVEILGTWASVNSGVLYRIDGWDQLNIGRDYERRDLARDSTRSPITHEQETYLSKYVGIIISRTQQDPDFREELRRTILSQGKDLGFLANFAKLYARYAEICERMEFTWCRSYSEAADIGGLRSPYWHLSIIRLVGALHTDPVQFDVHETYVYLAVQGQFKDSLVRKILAFWITDEG